MQNRTQRDSFISKLITRLNWRDLLGFIFAFSPALLLLILIEQHSVNVPVWDDWEIVPLIEKAEHGELTFDDLYAPHISHRMVFPRLLILGLIKAGGGDLRWLISATFSFGLAAGLGIWQLARQTAFKYTDTGWGILFLANLIIFSPLQWQNWLWAIQIAFMLPMTCIIWSLVICGKTHWRWWTRSLLCVALAIVSTHSFGHGIFIWPAVFGLVFLSPHFSKIRWHRWAFLGVWILFATAIITCYFGLDFKNTSDASHAYFQQPGEDPPMLKSHQVAKENPDKVWTFFATVVGNPFSRVYGIDPVRLAPKLGTILLIIFGASAMWVLIRCRKTEFWGKAVPWLALAGAALSAQVAVTVSRVGLGGLDRATVTRYNSISLYLIISILFLIVLIWLSLEAAWWKARRKTLGTIAIATLAGMQLSPWLYGKQMMQLWEWSRYEEQASLMFTNHWEPLNPHRTDATINFPRRHANTLNRLGYLKPKLVEKLDLKQFKIAGKPVASSRGKVETFESTENGQISISGYVQIGAPNYRPADGVLLTWETKKQKPMIFSLIDSGDKPAPRQYHFDLEFTGRASLDPMDFFRWGATIDRKRIPETGPVTLKVWAFDVKKMKAHALHGSWQLLPDGTIEKNP